MDQMLQENRTCTTQLKKLMEAFCTQQGKDLSTFLFEGMEVRQETTTIVATRTEWYIKIETNGLLDEHTVLLGEPQPAGRYTDRHRWLSMAPGGIRNALRKENCCER
ncbi:conserved hypothetical protein [Histoplasma capsulatum var. duboisii H88]|uniref:Uncharacterized protein n=1 Tax=Ajellomyces capsulatus (strain H88) TaxID=544711 RepID=F0UH50_AJEC8|nr:conserved hypothetical protein [Histoplasma capsulatum var. duboisii H88]